MSPHLGSYGSSLVSTSHIDRLSAGGYIYPCFATAGVCAPSRSAIITDMYQQSIGTSPYYPDVPEVRRDIARHLSSMMVMDKQVGGILKQLDEDGLANTIIFFYSDHGDGLPFVKCEIYDRGLQVPLIIRFARNFPALNHYGKQGITDDQLISFVDLAPTMLSLTGIPIHRHMQG